MTDNIVLNDNTTTGQTLATDDIGGVHHQLVKLEYGVADSATQVSTTNPLPVNLYAGGTTLAVGGGVEAGALRVTIASDSTGLVSVDDGGGSLTVDNADLTTIAGAVAGSEMQVDVVTSALPTGAATEATLSSIDTELDKLTVASATASAGLEGTQVMGACTTSNPTYVTGNTYPLSLTTQGLLRVAIAGTTTGIFQPVDLQRVGGGTVAVGIGATGSTVQRVALVQEQLKAATTQGDGILGANVGGSSIHSYLHAYEDVDGTWDMVRQFTLDTAQATVTANNTKGPLVMALRKDTGASIVDTDGDFTALQVDSSGNLRVNVAAGGGSGGTSSTDDSAFTAGSGSGTPAMGFFSTDTVDAGDVGVLAMDASRRLLVSIEADNAGIGGGTQYAEGDVAATITGTAALAEGPGNALTPLLVDGSQLLQVDIAADSVGLGGGTQYTEGDVDATITGTALMFEGAANTLVAATGDATNGLDVDVTRVSGTVTVDGSGVTQPISAASLPLPSGAATSALQTTGNTSLSTIAGAVSGTEMQVDIVSGSVGITGAVDTELPAAAALADAAANPTTPTVGAAALLFNGTTWDRMRGSTTDGLLVNLGSNNDVTVTGAVTANAGTNLNTSLLALESGGNLATIAGAVSGTEMQVDVLTMPTVTVNGTVTANAGTGPWPVTDNGGSLTVDNATLSVTGTGTATGALRVAFATSSTVAVTQTTASNLNAQVVGNVAHAATDSGNPVKLGAKTTDYHPDASGEPSGNKGEVTAGQRSDLAANRYGELIEGVNGVFYSLSTIEDTYDGTTTTNTDTARECWNYRQATVSFTLVSGGTPTDILFEVEVSCDNGSNYTKLMNGPLGLWKYDDTICSTAISRSLTFPIACTHIRVKVTAAGTTGTGTGGDYFQITNADLYLRN